LINGSHGRFSGFEKRKNRWREDKETGDCPEKPGKENLEVPGLAKFSLLSVDAGPKQASNFPVAVL
jgi:hypothetical protein